MELLVVMAIVALLAAISIPAMTKARSWADQTACTQNLRQIGVGLLLYAGEHQSKLPSSSPNAWAYNLRDYVPSDTSNGGSLSGRGAFICPARLRILRSSDSSLYALNFFFYSDVYGASVVDAKVLLNQVTAPSRTILAGDCHIAGKIPYKTIQSDNLPGINSGAGYTPPQVGKHGDGAANLLFVDGHIEPFANASELSFAKYRDKGADDLWNPVKK